MNDEHRQSVANLPEFARRMIESGDANIQCVGDGDPVVLLIRQAESGQWSGRIFDGHGVELGTTTGCESPEDVQRLTIGGGHQLTHIVRIT